MQKARSQTFPGLLLLAGILARLRGAFKFKVPVGYQDEDGFHYGVPKPKQEKTWPPFW
jgi:hypothetical protein